MPHIFCTLKNLPELDARRVEDFCEEDDAASYVFIDGKQQAERKNLIDFCISNKVLNQLEEFQKRFTRFAHLTLTDQYLLRLPQGKVISDGFFVADKHNHIISDSLRTIGLIERFGWTQKRPKIIETQVDTQKHFAGNYLCLGAQTNSNYFHWLFESISRLNLMDKLYPSGNYKIIVPPLRAFQQEIFDFLKIPEDRLHIFGGSEESYDTLFFATRGIGNIHSFSLEAVNYLSSLASPYRMTTQPRGRYLISRQRCTSRRITNENTLFDYLQTEHGFERIFCEDLNFTDQVKLFANAEIIIGALGAGLTNTVFAPADATLIELAPEGREGDSTLFWNLAAAKGQGYACIVGYQGKNQSLVAHDRRNFTISLAMLKKIMSQI